MNLTEQQLQQVKMEHPEWFIEIKEGCWYKRLWDNADVDIFYMKKFSNQASTTNPYYRNGKEIGDNVPRVVDYKNDRRYIISEATPEEVAAVHKPSISEAIEAFKKQHPEYNLTIIAEKK